MSVCAVQREKGLERPKTSPFWQQLPSEDIAIQRELLKLRQLVEA